MIVIKARSKK